MFQPLIFQAIPSDSRNPSMRRFLTDKKPMAFRYDHDATIFCTLVTCGQWKIKKIEDFFIEFNFRACSISICHKNPNRFLVTRQKAANGSASRHGASPVPNNPAAARPQWCAWSKASIRDRRYAVRPKSCCHHLTSC